MLNSMFSNPSSSTAAKFFSKPSLLKIPLDKLNFIRQSLRTLFVSTYVKLFLSKSLTSFKLYQKYGTPFIEYVYNGKTRQLNNFLQFLINGTSTSTLNGLETELKDDDVL